MTGGAVTVNSVTRNDSTSLTLDVTVGNAAATGPPKSTLTVAPGPAAASAALRLGASAISVAPR
jgi:hypothetical protein